jgi:hypothetical protein
MSEWTTFVTDLYKKKHATNKNYTFKKALKDASKEYKKPKSNTKKRNTRKRK